MFESYLLSHPWIPTLTWVILYTSDYYMTLWGARLYHAQSIMEFEGSYELTPEYQKDVDNQRKFSPTFLLWLIFGAAVLLATGLVSEDILFLYGILVGALLLPEVVVIIRHIDNIIIFKQLAASNPGVSGHIRYCKRFTYHMSSVQMLGLAVLAVLAFALTGSAILLGGVLKLILLAVQHLRLSAHHKNIITEGTPDTPSEVHEQEPIPD